MKNLIVYGAAFFLITNGAQASELSFSSQHQSIVEDLFLPKTTTPEELKDFLNQRKYLTISEQLEEINTKLAATNEEMSPQNYYFVEESSHKRLYRIAKDPLQVLLEKPDGTVQELNKILKEGIKRNRHFFIDDALYKDIVQAEDTPAEKIEDYSLPLVPLVQRIFAFMLINKLSLICRELCLIYSHELGCYVFDLLDDLFKYDPSNSDIE